MDVQKGYNLWSESYDTDQNKTRDLEGVTLQSLLAGKRFGRTLEIGCGTGKNTSWLQHISDQIVAVDFSEKMLSKARQKISSPHVFFVQADIRQPWDFVEEPFDLVTFSLVLEHLEELAPPFQKAEQVLCPQGILYIGELHPFKQYGGTKARFSHENERTELPAFVHHVSDFIHAAQSFGLSLERMVEAFDEDPSNEIPRILSLVFKKP